ncbi:Hypothetical predicted protein [Olea europaea subsp. europaea]|uniref:Uncharacterized protein n=1 Tax=Olea europaea subsp. europaea TaxID=158383 RepID=A0A8S0UT33_OLEEU|nr:Hypothetical predicted protein [Olea europaea subsp. europaea]
MKKQKIRASSSTPTPSIDLKSIILSHSQFFDHLVELIPAKFYLSNDDAESKPWYQGLSKAAKASLKQQSRQNLKLARRNRLDPENKSSSTLHLLQQQINKISESDPDELNREGSFGDLVEDGDTGEARVKSIDLEEGIGNVNRNESVTYEELRQKLRKRIELLRGNRGEGGGKKVDMVKNAEKKRKRGENDGEESSKAGNVDVNDGEDGEEIIEYGKVKLGDEEERKNKKKKKKKNKMSKIKELEKAKRLQEVKRENIGVAERESWKAATSRAMGVKVHDDARMIKESMKKEKRKKEKNAEKWKERVESQEKIKNDRQQKRKDNIMGRIKEKKMRKIVKREKKLMRPGFEGRKEGYITTKD